MLQPYHSRGAGKIHGYLNIQGPMNDENGHILQILTLQRLVNSEEV